jgi:hypothetical protein
LKNRKLLVAVAVCASSGAWAADVSQTVNQLGEATKVIDRCTGIAKRISAMPVPPGHEQARAAEHFNESITKAPAPTGAAGAPPAPAPVKMAIAPEHQAFMNNIRAARNELQKCGEDFVRVHKPADALEKREGEALEKKAATAPTEDDKKIAAAITAYNTASENLTTAITALSKDSIHERYVGRVVNKYFLERE